MAEPRTTDAIDARVRVGHAHLKVADLERATNFYCGVLGFELKQRYGKQAAFIAAGGYHHHIGLNTWESEGGSPPPPGTTGLYHIAILYPTRALLADALRRLIEAGITLDGASDHGVSEALYLRDPDDNGIELYWDRPEKDWPRAADGSIAMYTRPLDLQALLAQAPYGAALWSAAPWRRFATWGSRFCQPIQPDIKAADNEKRRQGAALQRRTMKGNSSLEGIIFDMDGVLVDSNPFHLQKWVALLDAHHIPYDPQELPKYILGHRNDTAFRYFFGSQITDAETEKLSEELEEWFRREFKPHARPVPGLRALVEECHRAGIPMAVASSAMGKNVEFVVAALGFQPYFRNILSGDEVTHPKPHPEIYLKTAAKLGLAPSGCVAFEDSFVGLESAKRAGMKCVAIASTFPREELLSHGHADLVVGSFEELSLASLRGIFR